MSDMPAVGDKSVNDKCATYCGGLFGPSYEVVDADHLQQNHFYVLQNTLDVMPYVEEHMQMLSSKATLVRKGPQWVQNEHSRTFVSWFKQKVRSQLTSDEDGISETIRWLSYGTSDMKMEDDTQLPDSPVEDSPVEDLPLIVKSQKSSHSANNRSRKNDKVVEASSKPLKGKVHKPTKRSSTSNLSKSSSNQPSKGSYSKKSKSRSKLACKGSVSKKSKSSSKVQGSRKEENNKEDSSKEENNKRGKRKRTWDLRGPAKCLKLRKLKEEMFDICEDMKWNVWTHANNLWRGWKCRLNQFDVQPLRYTYSAALKNIPKREKNLVSVKEWNKFVEWMEEGDEEPDRVDGWMWARMNSSCGFDDPEVHVIVKRILRLKAKKKNGTLKLNANEDILSKAQRKKVRAGRSPACGFNATKGMLFLTKKLNAATAELCHLREKLKKFKESSSVSGENSSQGKNKSIHDRTMFNMKEMKASMRTVFMKRMTCILLLTLTRGPSYPHEFINTEIIEEILNKHPNFLEKDCTLYCWMDGVKVIVARRRVLADGTRR
ncbi:hypothetical protein ACFE04_023430 [Oxalis oulophora]